MLGYRRETAQHMRYSFFFAKCTRLVPGDNILRTPTGLKSVEFGEKNANLKAVTAFKVIEVDTNRNPVCDFILVINSN